jgi:molybdopterin converting factor subunit 1
VIRILLFAGLAESIGAKEITVPLQGERITVGKLRTLLSERYPAVRDLIEQSMVAVNEEYISVDSEITAQDVVAIIPPVSGG